MSRLKYVHDVRTHNTDAPSEIVPIIYALFNPASVVDVGCGTGTFLYCFKQAGVQEVLGIDGAWADKNLIKPYLSDKEFKAVDLEEPFNLGRKFDLAICVEVAEHLSEQSADAFIKNLCSLSDVILFSAAIPGQGGQNHLNEQWPVYWEKKFNTSGFEFHDIIRSSIWDNDKIFWWYRQNIFVAVKNGFKLNSAKLPGNNSAASKNLVHPELFKYYAALANISTRKLQLIEEGNYSVKVYLKLLMRAIKRKLNMPRKSFPVLVFNPKDPFQK